MTLNEIKPINTHMLISLLLVPILGSLIAGFLPESNLSNKNRIKQISLFTSIVNFILSLLIWAQFNPNLNDYQYIVEFKYLNLFHFNLGIDGISLYFVLLTTFITPVAILANYQNITQNVKYFFLSFLILETLQIAAFISLDLLLFYIFFESVLPILFVLIILYGHGTDRFRSAFLLFLYTLGASLPMLLSILIIYNYVGSTDFQLIDLSSSINLENQKWLWLGFFLAFAVKTPLYPFSIWLPKAHADSPLAGSVILAATILKLATYGYLRVLIHFLPDATHYFSPMVQTIAIITIIYAKIGRAHV